MTEPRRLPRSSHYVIGVVLLGMLAIGSSIAAATTLASTFVSSGCEMERHGELLSGMLMPGTSFGELRFKVECREFGTFRLTPRFSGSADLAAAAEVQVSLGKDLLYRGPLSELAISQRLMLGSSEIVVRGMLPLDSSASGQISLELTADVAGI